LPNFLLKCHFRLTFCFGKDPQQQLMVNHPFPQVIHSKQLIIASVGLILSIAVFNWSGVSVTTYLNATTRMIIGTLTIGDMWVTI
jgi:hypothetical protein